MFWFRLVIVGICLYAWCGALFCNLYEPIKWVARRGKRPGARYRHLSPIPIIGGLAGLITVALIPDQWVEGVPGVATYLVALLPEIILWPQFLYAMVASRLFTRSP